MNILHDVQDTIHIIKNSRTLKDDYMTILFDMVSEFITFHVSSSVLFNSKLSNPFSSLALKESHQMGDDVRCTDNSLTRKSNVRLCDQLILLHETVVEE